MAKSSTLQSLLARARKAKEDRDTSSADPRLDSFANRQKLASPEKRARSFQRPPPAAESSDEESEEADNEPQEASEASFEDDAVSEAPSGPTPEEVRAEKEELLFQLYRLESQGYKLPRPVSMETDLDELRFEHSKITYEIETKSGVAFARQLLMVGVSGTEYLTTRWNPLKLRLQGWSSNVMSDIDSYDPTLERLYSKWSRKYRMPPEMELLTMLGGSAFMFHLQQSMTAPQRSAAPSSAPTMMPPVPEPAPPAPPDATEAQEAPKKRAPMRGPPTMDTPVNPAVMRMLGSAANAFPPPVPPVPEAVDEDAVSTASEAPSDDSVAPSVRSTQSMDRSAGRGRGRGRGRGGRGGGGRGRGVTLDI